MRSADRQNDLRRALLGAAAAPDVERFLEEALGLLTRAVDADHGYVALGEGATSRTPQWFRAHPPALAAEVQDQLSTGVLHDVVDGGLEVVTEVLRSDPRYRTRESVRGTAIGGMVCLPLGASGVLWIAEQRTRGFFTDEEVELLRLAATHLGGPADRIVRQYALDGDDPASTLRRKLRAHELIGASQAFATVLRHVAVAAPAPVPVLLTGPSGTGKSALARLVHQNGPHPAGRFEAINCADLDPNRLQADLFGAAKGSYTSLHEDRPGLVERVRCGTLFLDEVGDLPLPVQAQLLLFLQEGTYRWLGESTTRRADRVRVVAATHRDLPAMVADGRFREDLWFRLSTFVIRVPSLRERARDLPLLCQTLLGRFAPVLGVSTPPGVSVAALDWLERQPWPGNLRELENVLKRALLWANHEGASVLTVDHLERPGAPATAEAAPTLAQAVHDFERRFVAQVLADTPSRTEAARRLGIHRTHLYDLQRRLGLSDVTDTDPRG